MIKKVFDMSQSPSNRLTQGPIVKSLVRFAVPLFLGNLFQQMYNTADSLVVGNFVGSSALAAVVSSQHLCFLVIGFLQGLFIGAGAIIAHAFGAEDGEELCRAVRSTVAMALTGGLVLSALGVIFSPAILRLMGTPEQVLPNSVLYFRLYFGGLITTVLYNCAASILQATGDSRRPLFYLVTASCANVTLDVLFVAVFQWGVAGVGSATILSQALSAFLAFSHLARSGTAYGRAALRPRFFLPQLRRMLRVGIPSGIQNSIISLSNMTVQSHINSFGALAVAGCGIAARLEGFIFMPISSFALAVTTFVGQNMGAGEGERARKGAWANMALCMTVAQVSALALRLHPEPLLRLFDASPEVLAYGTQQIMISTPFYFLPSATHCMAGSLRGLGRAVTPMAVTMICWCVVRVTYLEVLLSIRHEMWILQAVYPFTWFLSAAALLFFFLRAPWGGDGRRAKKP